LVIAVFDEAGEGPGAHRKIVLWLVEMPPIDKRVPSGSLLFNGAATFKVIVAGYDMILVVHMLDICKSSPMKVLP